MKQSMAASANKALRECLCTMMVPVARFCLSRSLRLQDVIDAAKFAFLEAARDQLKKQGKKATISRLSIMTGVHRPDLARMINGDGELKRATSSLAGRVIAQWRNDKRFLTESGRPRVLSFKGIGNEFTELVEAVSIDLKPGTVLFDLERVGAVSKTSKGLKLLHGSYVPRGDPGEGFRLIARDTNDLMEAGMHNIFNEGEVLNYHAAAVYDNISEEDLPKIRKWFFKNCRSFHQRVQKMLSKYDLDITPDATGKKKGGKRVTLGIFSRTTE